MEGPQGKRGGHFLAREGSGERGRSKDATKMSDSRRQLRKAKILSEVRGKHRNQLSKDFI